MKSRWASRLKTNEEMTAHLNVGITGPMQGQEKRFELFGGRQIGALGIDDPERGVLEDNVGQATVNDLELGESRAEIIGLMADLETDDQITLVAEIPRVRKNVQTRIGLRFGLRFGKHCSTRNYRDFIQAAYDANPREAVDALVREEQIDALRAVLMIDHKPVMAALLRVLRQIERRQASTPGQSAFLRKMRTDDDAAASIAEGAGAASAALKPPPGGWPTLGLSSPWRPFLLAWGRAMLGRPTDDTSGCEALARLVEKQTGVASESIALHIIVALVTAQTWAEAGFPLVIPTHRLAAALMATAMPAELAEEVAIPWTQFVVAIPHGLLPPLSLPSDLAPLAQFPVMVGFARNGDKKFSEDDVVGGYYLWSMGPNVAPIVLAHLATLSDLADLPIESLQRGPMQCSEELAKMLHGHMRLAARLVLGAMIELDGAEHRDRVTAVVERAKKTAPQSGPHEAPTRPETFELRRDVKVDARPWVKALFDTKRHVSGDVPLRGVRVLVRGHHRRVAHGPGRLLRKWISVEPFWSPRDERLPIAVRAHRIGGGGDDAR